eukprot:TRINITY_DN388_c1_g1_i1.p3 TRINITY_DN388_c1_g1~~TRINITY_DN388_c1_g1_i1.p3  ORF type:complete len:132 (-),score=3.68 TRINITY_DN388_c1_g1_i1:575-970(-)
MVASTAAGSGESAATRHTLTQKQEGEIRNPRQHVTAGKCSGGAVFSASFLEKSAVATPKKIIREKEMEKGREEHPLCKLGKRKKSFSDEKFERRHPYTTPKRERNCFVLRGDVWVGGWSLLCPILALFCIF